MWRSPRPEYAEPPNAAVKGGIGDRQNTPSSMTHTPKSPALTTIPPTSHTAVPTLHQTTNSPNARVRGSRGAGPPGRGSAAAVGRRRCRENAGATSCRPHEAPEGIFFAHVLRSAMSQFMLRSMCTASVFRRQTHRGRAQTALFPAAKGGIIGFRAKPERGEGSAEWLRRSGLI